jgi:hypothetical protein
MNPNDCVIDYGSADTDDDAFYQENKLFDDDSNNDVDKEELVLDGMVPKRGGGGGHKLSPGGPPPHETDGIMEQKVEAALKRLHRNRKQYVNKLRHTKRKQSHQWWDPWMTLRGIILVSVVIPSAL